MSFRDEGEGIFFLQFSAETFVPNAPALFAYAERAAVLGGAQLLVVLQSEDAALGLLWQYHHHYLGM